MSKLEHPIFFKPVYRDYLWGGNKIAERFGRVAPEPPVAESWEISDREEGMSHTEAGVSLRELVREHGVSLLGEDAERFPLLLKILDANRVLSVQVHPDDETAANFGGEAKTEAWYILDAEPGAAVYCGLQPGVDEAMLREGIDGGEVEGLLRKIPVKRGETVFVPGGRVHAIAAGCLIFEVQQNSNTTYRLHDWGRGREEHVEQGMQVVRWDDEDDITPDPKLIAEAHEELVRCPHFVLERLSGSRAFAVGTHGGFEALFLASGRARLGEVEMVSGQSCLLPACLAPRDILLEEAELLRVFMPA